MTKMLTDDDLRVIEDLDFEPGCDSESCDRPATWVLIGHLACCSHRATATSCDRCKEWSVENDPVQFRGMTCLYCTAPDPIVPIDRIEPLR